MTATVVVDLDGTLCHETVASNCMGDTHTKQDILQIMDPIRIIKLQPKTDVIIETNRLYANDNKIIIVTSRWDLLIAPTRAWLKYYDVKFHALIMRHHEHWQLPSITVKSELFKRAEMLLLDSRNRYLWIDNDEHMLVHASTELNFQKTILIT